MKHRLSFGKIWPATLLALVCSTAAGLAGMKFGTRGAGASAASREVAQAWICPMHAQVQSDQPGQCPICKMDLVRKGGSAAAESGSLATTESDGSGVVVQNLAVRLAAITRREIANEIVTYGTASAPAAGARTVTPKVDGWVRALHVSTAGQKISAGQPLYDFYSPELIQRQREYIDVLDRKEKLASQMRDLTGQNAQVLAALARDRVNMRRTLLAADLDLETLTYLERVRRPIEVITMRAAEPSVVTAVSATAGAYMTPMTPILSMASASRIWIDVVIYPDQANWIRGGEVATVRSGKHEVTGRLELPNLLVDPVSKVLHGRIEVPFDDAIRPGSAVMVALACSPRLVLAAPSAALIRRGGRDYVMRWESEGRFRPAEVTVGIRNRDFVEIRRGLSEGDHLAAAGEFLIDADSSLERSSAGSPL
jgi:Cu(I)/Ag(I) efflux system membrane fusion protein